MTNYEFKAEYDKLVEVYPQNFNSDHKQLAIWSYVKDLEIRWWKALVNRMILSSNPRIDIEDAGRGERIAKQRERDTKAMFQLQDQLQDKISENGLEEVLEKLGKKSLVDAIFDKDVG